MAEVDEDRRIAESYALADGLERAGAIWTAIMVRWLAAEVERLRDAAQAGTAPADGELREAAELVEFFCKTDGEPLDGPGFRGAVQRLRAALESTAPATYEEKAIAAVARVLEKHGARAQTVEKFSGELRAALAVGTPAAPAPEPTTFLDTLADNLGLTSEQRVELRALHAKWDAALAPFAAELERSMDPGDTSIRVSGGATPAARPAEPPPPNPLDVLALARLAAKRHHYALTVHGSLARDLDLVAVPWQEDASEATALVEAIRKAVGGWIMVPDDSPDKGRDGYLTIDDGSKHSPSERPHGRVSWSIYGVLGGAYLDLSVMPLRAAPPPSEEYGNPHREQPGWIKDNPPFAKQGENWPPPPAPGRAPVPGVEP